MAELDAAIMLANKTLDTQSRDPDDDLSVLARQFLRSRERTEVLSRALAFASSVIKSGESWTNTCERVIGDALGTKCNCANEDGDEQMFGHHKDCPHYNLT